MSTKNKLRKRYLVTEGDLFQLYRDIELIRKKEDKEQLMQSFKKLLKEAQPVELIVKSKN